MPGGIWIKKKNSEKHYLTSYFQNKYVCLELRVKIFDTLLQQEGDQIVFYGSS